MYSQTSQAAKTKIQIWFQEPVVQQHEYNGNDAKNSYKRKYSCQPEV